MSRVILHIDFDSFFASVAQQEMPRYRGKPIGITATNGRTCLIAASREAKRLGIKTPLRTFEALRICPDIVFAAADFRKYWEVSKQFIAICKDYSPLVEVFSIDELFLDITQTAHLFGGTPGVIARIKERIQHEIGPFITVSVGVSHNKLLAKLASGLKKPDGVFVIGEEDVLQVYQHIALTDMCGIGGRIQDRLLSMGISTPLKLQKAPLTSLIAEFGMVEGQLLKRMGMGVDDSPVLPFTHVEEAKSVGRNYCLPQNEYDQRRILQNIYELCEEVAIKLRKLHKKARTVGLSLRGSYDIHGRKTYPSSFDTGKELFEACLRLVDKGTFQTGYTRQISIWTSNLIDSSSLSLSLFPRDRKKRRVTEVIDALNDRFGDHTVRNGFLLYADKLTTMPNGYMADTFERRQLLSDQRLQV